MSESGKAERTTKKKKQYKLNWRQIIQRLESAQAIVALSGDENLQLDEAVACLRERLGMPPQPPKAAHGVKLQVLSALETAYEHVLELRNAWQRGLLTEQAWEGGTRANRNVDVEVALRAAIAKASEGEG